MKASLISITIDIRTVQPRLRILGVRKREILNQKSRDYHERGIKAARTRAQNERHNEMRRRGKKAGGTVTESELRYIDKLIKTEELSRNQIFHHVGLPDLMVITDDGKVRFYEIKPKKGGVKRTMLNPNQADAIMEALKNERVEEISLVRYTKLGKGKRAEYVYDSPTRLTKSNINKYALSRT